MNLGQRVCIPEFRRKSKKILNSKFRLLLEVGITDQLDSKKWSLLDLGTFRSFLKPKVIFQFSMETWTRNAVKYSLDNGFDGIDLDWEYPAKTTVDTSPPEDYENFQTLCEIMRDYIDNNHPGFLLTAAVGIGKEKFKKIFLSNNISKKPMGTLLIKP